MASCIRGNASDDEQYWYRPVIIQKLKNLGNEHPERFQKLIPKIKQYGLDLDF